MKSRLNLRARSTPTRRQASLRSVITKKGKRLSKRLKSRQIPTPTKIQRVDPRREVKEERKGMARQRRSRSLQPAQRNRTAASLSADAHLCSKLKKGKQVVLVPDPSVRMHLIVCLHSVLTLQDHVEKFLAARTNDGTREFLVKHKHTSYHHLTWLPEEVLVEMQTHNKGRIQRWVEGFGEPEPKSDDVAETVRSSAAAECGLTLLSRTSSFRVISSLIVWLPLVRRTKSTSSSGGTYS